MRRALILSLLQVGACVVAQPGPEVSVVLTGERALMVLPPRLVAAGDVYNVSASPSGRYLVAFQEVPSERPLELGKEPPEPKAKNIVVWDSLTGGTRTMSLAKSVNPRRCFTRWFHGTDRALIEIEISESMAVIGSPGATELGVHREWHLLNAASGEVRRVHSDEDDGVAMTYISMCPTAPIAVRVAERFDYPEPRKDWIVQMQTLSADGQWGLRVNLPLTFLHVGATEWAPDGKTFQMEVFRAPETKGKFIPRVVQFNPATGGYTDVLGPVPRWEYKERQRDVALVNEGRVLEDNPTKRPLVTVWLKAVAPSESPQALVAEHATSAELAPGERFVAYTSSGALFTRQIVQMSADEYRQMKLASTKAETISRAKQAALACLMYASDYDDTIPENFDLKDLFPYHKNPKLIEGFVLVFPGGRLSDVKDPANTVLGYIPGPGGRAVAYIDGHVRWEATGG